MSDYGLQVFNAAGDLCLAVIDDAAHLHYLGTATYETDTDGMPGWWIGTDQRCTSYLISSPGGPPLVFIRMPLGSGYYSVASVTLVSGTTYRISIVDSNGNPNTRTRPTLDCFGYLTSNTPAADYGVQVFNSFGQVVTDTTRNPLIAARVYAQAASVGSRTDSAPGLSIDLSGLTTPAINYHANGRGHYITTVSGTRFIKSVVPVVRRTAGGAGESTWIAATPEVVFGGGAPNGFYCWSGVMSCLVIDMAKYL